VQEFAMQQLQVEQSQQQDKENIASTANCPTVNSQPSKKINKRSKTLAKKSQ
jgi:hypothetical protein